MTCQDHTDYKQRIVFTISRAEGMRERTYFVRCNLQNYYNTKKQKYNNPKKGNNKVEAGIKLQIKRENTTLLLPNHYQIIIQSLPEL